MKSRIVKTSIILILLFIFLGMLLPAATSSAAIPQSTGNTGVNHLVEFGSISGKVYGTDATTPIAGFQVTAGLDNGSASGIAFTSSDGSYTITGLNQASIK